MSLQEVAGRTYRQALPTITVSAAGGLLAGIVLSDMRAQLAVVRGLLVMIPAFLAIRGSVYGSFGSRLSTGLHQGLIEPILATDDRLLAAVAAALLNGMAASVFAAILTYGVLTAFDIPVAPLAQLLMIAVVAGLLAGISLILLVIGIVFGGYQYGWDPDVLVGPAVTTGGDIFGMTSLYIATKLVIAVTA